MQMEQKIFLSVGRTYTQQQEEFVSSLEEFMRSQGIIPQTVGRTYFSSQQPLVAVAELMRQCSGTLVVPADSFPSAPWDACFLS